MSHLNVTVVARSTVLHPRSGGMETSADALYSALHSLGYSVSMVTTATGDATRDARLIGDPRFSEVCLVDTGRPGRYSMQWWLKSWTASRSDHLAGIVLSIGDSAITYSIALPRSRPLVVHCHGTTMMEVQGALAVGGFKGIARALVNFLRTPSRMYLLRRATRVMPVSEEVAGSLTKAPYRVPAANVVVLPNAVSITQNEFSTVARASGRQQLGVATNSKVALFLGRVEAEKGPGIAIKSLAHASSEWHLIVVGEGSEAGELRQLAVALGVHERVHFVGVVRQLDVAKFMSVSDVLVFPTRRREGLPMILLEAAANGLPIVTTEWARVPRDIEATIVAPQPQSLAEGMERAVKCRRPDSYLPARFSAAGLVEQVDLQLRVL